MTPTLTTHPLDTETTTLPAPDRVSPRRRSTDHQAVAWAERTSSRYLLSSMPAPERHAWQNLTSSPIGRPTKLQPDRVRKLLDSVRIGLPITPAAWAAGLDEGTVRDWISRGEADTEAGRITAHAVFLRALKDAEGQAVAYCASKLATAANNDWQRWAWMLERRWPEWFARRDGFTLVPNGQPVEVVVRHVHDWRGGEVIDVEPEPGDRAVRARREAKSRAESRTDRDARAAPDAATEPLPALPARASPPGRRAGRGGATDAEPVGAEAAPQARSRRGARARSRVAGPSRDRRGTASQDRRGTGRGRAGSSRGGPARSRGGPVRGGPARDLERIT
jgi:hypothetical protein